MAQSIGSVRRMGSARAASVAPPAATAAGHRVSVEAEGVAKERRKVGVLLLNLGGPTTTADVRPFLTNLFSDPDIFQLPTAARPFQPLIARAISARRSGAVEDKYASIGGGSPIGRLTAEQASGLADELARRGHRDVDVLVGMRYWHPFARDSLAELRGRGVTDLVLLPLYPHYSSSTTASALRDVERQLLAASASGRELDSLPRVAALGSWHSAHRYVESVARGVVRSLRGIEPLAWTAEGGTAWGGGREDRAAAGEGDVPAGGDGGPVAPIHILFSAHGVPKAYVARGDPYEDEIRECAEAVMAKVRELWDLEPAAGGPEGVSASGPPAGASSASAAPTRPATPSRPLPNYSVCFQSRIGPVEWLKPYTADAIEALGRRGTGTLVVVPIAFVSEHIETLEEMDMEYAQLAREAGVARWVRVPALDADPIFLAALADLVEQAIPLCAPLDAAAAAGTAGAGDDAEPVGVAARTLSLPSRGAERARAISARVSREEAARAAPGILAGLRRAVFP